MTNEPTRRESIEAERASTDQTIENTPNKKKWSKRTKITAGLALAATLVGGGFATKAVVDNISNQPVAVGPENPGEAPVDPTDTPVDGGEEQPSNPENTTIESIPAGLETEQLASEIVDRLTLWRNAGFNEENIQAWLAYPGETGDFATGIAQENARQFAETLFIADWKGSENLTVVAENYSTNNAAILERALKTFDETYDEEPYRTWFTIDETREVSNDGTARVIEVDVTNMGNSDKNRVGEDFGLDTAALEGDKSTFTITIVTENGFDKISAFNTADRP